MLADEFVAVAVHLSLVQVQLVDLAQRLLGFQGAIHGSVANWLSVRAGLSGAEAKQVCRVARGLGGLALIEAAFRAGRLSLDTTDVLMKVATADNEAVVLETAGAATGAQLRKIIATFRRVRAGDTPEPSRDERAGFGQDEVMWWLSARLQPARGAEFEAALRAAREDLFASIEPVDPPDGAGAAGTVPARPPVSVADALVHMSRTYLETKLTASGQLPERFHTIIHVDLDRAHIITDDDFADDGDHGDDGSRAPGGDAATEGAPAENREKHPDADPGDGHDHPGPNREQRRRLARSARPARDGPLGLSVTNRDDIAYLRGIGALDGPSLNQVLCTSTISVVGTRDGVAVTATSPTRFATPAQRRALLALHPTCQFPGCGHTAYLDAHHVIAHHPVTGPTALWNLALLCSACHTRLHQPGWTAVLTDDHTLRVWDPHGNLLSTGALRTETTATATATDADAKFAKIDTGRGDPDQRLHGTGERLSAFGLDVYLHAWLEATAA